MDLKKQNWTEIKRIKFLKELKAEDITEENIISLYYLCIYRLHYVNPEVQDVFINMVEKVLGLGRVFEPMRIKGKWTY